MDLLIVLFITICAGPLIFWEPLTSLRIASGLILVLIFPGYTLIAALFPRKNDLDGIERVGLGLGVSFALIPIIGLVLNFSPWGIRFESVLIASLLWTISLSCLAIYRRTLFSPEEGIRIQFLKTVQWVRNHRRPPDIAITMVIILSLLGLIGAISWRIQTPPPGDPFTEFYVLGEGGMLQDYPINLSVGVTEEYRLGIVNNQHSKTIYKIRASLDQVEVGQTDDIHLEVGAKWEGKVYVIPTVPSTEQKLIFELYRDGQVDPNRKLHLFVDIQPDPNSS